MAILTPCPACPACGQSRARGTHPSTDGDGDEDGGDDDDENGEYCGDDDGSDVMLMMIVVTKKHSTCVNVVSGLGKR